MMETAQSLVMDNAPDSSRFNCLSESAHQIKHEPGLQSMDIPFFWNGFKFLFGLLTISIIVLIIEHQVAVDEDEKEWIIVTSTK